jgi:hypothetical protein
MALPESRSIWPVHVLGNPRWIEFNLKRWSQVKWRDPRDAAYQVVECWRWCDYIYRLVRDCRPKVAIETGVYFGRSSAAILAALQHDGMGRLISIDLPTASDHFNEDGMMEASSGAYWRTGCLVPNSLRPQWELRLGDAKDLLPTAVDGGIGFFLHDSEHTYRHMTFEYETAWKALAVGGILASDDTDWPVGHPEMPHAWPEFLERHRGECRLLPEGPVGLRAIRRTS